MSIRNEQCKKVCKILDDVLANRPSERDTLIVAVQKAFDALADDGWISVEDRLPEINTHVLISRKEWPYPTPDDGDRVFKGMRHKDPRSGEIK